jgi:hypothetical protein
MDGVLTTVTICRDGTRVAMGGVLIDLIGLSMMRQDANVREQSHEDQREHDGSQFSSPQHHRAERT